MDSVFSYWIGVITTLVAGVLAGAIIRSEAPRRRRSGRRGIMAIVAALLLLGPSAAQACAWVLWQEQQPISAAGSFGPRRWVIVQATTTEAACQAEAARITALFPKGAGGTALVTIPSGGLMLRTVCLPETTDPREGVTR